MAAVGCSDSSTAPRGKAGAGVTVTPRETRLDVGRTATLTAQVRGTDGGVVTGARVFWASEDTALAEVSPEGVVRAKAPGTVHIAASFAGTSDVVAVIIAPSPVASVAVSPPSQKVSVGATVQFRAATLDAGGQPLAGRAVTWASSDQSIAKVDGNGLVTGIAPGAAVITATSETRSAGAGVTVVAIPVSSVSLKPGSASLVVGQTTQLTAIPLDAGGTPLRDRTVGWTSSDQSVATVSSTGLVVALAPGSATITATAEGKSAAATVTVGEVPVGAVIVSPSPAQLTVGQTVQLSVQVTDANGHVVTDRPLTYASDDASVASVSGSGLVTGVAPGTTTVRVTSDGTTGTTSVMVGPVPVASVAVSPGSATLAVGGTTTLSATVRDAGGNTLSGRPVAWTSSNEAVATVSSSGAVTAIAPGSAVVFATAEGRSGQAQITVTPVPVATVAVAPSSSSVQVGQMVQLSATTRDANGGELPGRAVTWSSSDSRLALVSGSGVVTGVSPGTVTITATSEGKQGSATVTVTAAPGPVASVTISPSSAVVQEKQSVTLSATCRDSDGNALTGRTITWTSSDDKLATVDPSTGGSTTVHGNRQGEAKITASCEGVSATAPVTVQSAADE